MPGWFRGKFFSIGTARVKDLEVGSTGSRGTRVDNILSGSAVVTVASAATGTSVSATAATITGLTASHMIVAHSNQPGSAVLVSTCPGTNAASFVFGNWTGSDSASRSVTVRYIAFRPQAL